MTDTLKSLVGDLVPQLEEKPAATPVASDASPKPSETPPAPQVPADEAKLDAKGETVPLAIHMTEKHAHDKTQEDLESYRKENAELRKQFIQLKPGAAAPAAVDTPKAIEAKPDPLQVYIKKYTEDFKNENNYEPKLADIPVPADVLLERDQWNKENQAMEQENAQVEVRRNALRIASTQTMSDAAFGPGLGLDAVAGIGGQFLTAGDKVDIANAGENCAVVMYRACVRRAGESGTPEGQDLARRIQAQYQAENKPVVTPESLAETPPKEEEAPAKPSEEKPPASAEEAIGRHPQLSRLGLKQYAREA